MTRFADRGPSALRLMGWAAVLAPVGIVLHELGHLMAAHALGFGGARLQAASVSGGAQLGEDPGWVVAIQAASGPLVTLLLIAVAVWSIRRDRSAWGLALAATAPLRFIVDLVFLIFTILSRLRGQQPSPGNFDEYKLATALGVATEPVALVAVIVLVGTWILVWKYMGRERRLVRLIGLAAGATAGILAWMMVLGPALAGLINGS